MNPEPPSGASSSTSSATPTNQRKERGAIAAQACETCRSRKQKCDEQRPKCGTCVKFQLECRYREPQPTKKDKTLVEILDRIKGLEGRWDDTFGPPGSPNLSVFGSIQSRVGQGQAADTESHGSQGGSSLDPSGPASPATVRRGEYRYVSGAQKMLAWPVVQQELKSAKLNQDIQEMSDLVEATTDQSVVAVMLGVPGNRTALPNDDIGRGGPLAALQTHAGPLQLRAGMPWDTMRGLAKSYFDSFGFLYPIMDRESFNNSILPAVANRGFNEGTSSTLACLVFALSEVSVAGVQGMPIAANRGRPSGFKGGTLEQPPGLAFFNEARRRMGFSLTECSLENVQMFALAALYYGSCCHHAEFWRMTMSASLACQALLTSNPGILTSPRADLVRRIFWHCSTMETCLHLELDLPPTGLEKFQDLVGVPDFSGPFCEEDYLGNQTTHFQEHYASQIAWRRLTASFHATLSNALGATPTAYATVGSDLSSEGTQNTVKDMANQLDQWRYMLPSYLRWQESQPGALSSPIEDMFAQGLFQPGDMQDLQTGFMFTSDLDSPPMAYPYTLDVQVALLRTRYYYTKYLIYRPFVYKALHHPDAVTREDAAAAAECLKACLKWPITMSPTCYHKRMIPCLIFWSQNLLGILIILHLSQKKTILGHVRKNLCGDSFEVSAAETVNLYIDWIRDVKNIDPTARWCWSQLRDLYNLDP